MKKALSIGLAIVASYIVLKVLWWLMWSAFYIAMTLFQIVLVAVIAIPIYIILQKKVFK